LIACIVVLGSYQLYQFYKPFDDEIVERDHDGPGFVININKDHAVFLSQLKRIDGPLGLRITEWRNEHGPFRTVDDLTQVEGIDQSIVDANRKWMSVE
jgi:DNA uptake protein ComE-like DNA-binding protein